MKSQTKQEPWESEEGQIWKALESKITVVQTVKNMPAKQET